MNNTRKALKIGALYNLKYNKIFLDKPINESEIDNVMRSLFLKSNKTQTDILPENKDDIKSSTGKV